MYIFLFPGNYLRRKRLSKMAIKLCSHYPMNAQKITHSWKNNTPSGKKIPFFNMSLQKNDILLCLILIFLLLRATC